MATNARVCLGFCSSWKRAINIWARPWVIRCHTMTCPLMSPELVHICSYRDELHCSSRGAVYASVWFATSPCSPVSCLVHNHLCHNKPDSQISFLFLSVEPEKIDVVDVSVLFSTQAVRTVCSAAEVQCKETYLSVYSAQLGILLRHGMTNIFSLAVEMLLDENTGSSSAHKWRKRHCGGVLPSLRGAGMEFWFVALMK